MEGLIEFLLELIGGIVVAVAEVAVEKGKQKRLDKTAHKRSVLIEKIRNVDYRKIVKIVFTKKKMLFYYKDMKALKLKFSKITDRITPAEVKEVLLAKLKEINYSDELIIKG